MDDVRKLLDSMMGPNRNVKQDKADNNKPWKLEKNVCKFHLVGTCFTQEGDNMFKEGKKGLKRAVPESLLCKKLHSDAIRTEFEANHEYEKYKVLYQEEYLAALEKICKEADKFAEVERPRVKPMEKKCVMREGTKMRTDRLEEEVTMHMRKSVELAEEGHIEDSKEQVERARIKRKEIDVTMNDFMMNVGEGLCEVCGTRFTVADSASALGGSSITDSGLLNREAHYMSRTHKAYTKVRETVKELQEMGVKSIGAGRGRSRSASANRGPPRKRSRSRSRSRKKSRSRSRSAPRRSDRDRKDNRGDNRRRERSDSRPRRRERSESRKGRRR